MLATVVDTNALLDVVLYSAAAGIGLCVTFTLAVVLAAQGGEGRTSGARGAPAQLALAGVLLLACLGAVAFGLQVMFSAK